MLAVAVSGATDCRTGRELIGLHPASQRGLDLTGETAVPS
jgi:hypothetical protein